MKHENVVIFRNVFDPKEFESAAEKILTHKDAIRSQAETFGPVKKVELFDVSFYLGFRGPLLMLRFFP